jgi:glycosyltransferase involved in cell wall biosynthesis
MRSLENLDLVFYQSRELMEAAASLLGVRTTQLASDTHIVLPRGIPEPPMLASAELRKRVRSACRVESEQALLLYLGRITRQKGMVELLEALRIAAATNPSIRCLLVGSQPALDETALIESKLRHIPELAGRVRILAACTPDRVWEYFYAADIFLFPSHREGMPNSLLEAMAAGLPAIAFGIPAVRELENGTGSLISVPPFDCQSFANAVLRLAASVDERRRVGEKGKALVRERFIVNKTMVEVVRRLKLLTKENPFGARAIRI